MTTTYIQPVGISNFSTGDDGHFKKQALILAEGHWTDSNKKPHTFSAERIERIAQNTNDLYSNGHRIPLLKDHQKNQDNTIGDLNGTVLVREITEDDAGGNPSLIGRLGIFAKDVVIKSKKAIDDAIQGLIETISPGVDVVDDCIREISVTPIPAIPGMRLFSRSDLISKFQTMPMTDNMPPELLAAIQQGPMYGDMIPQGSGAGMTPMTWDAMNQPSGMDLLQGIKSELDGLNEQFFALLSNIHLARPEEMQGRDKLNLLEQALQEYTLRLAVAIGLGEPEEKTAQEEAIDMMRRNPDIRNYPYAGYSANNDDMANFYLGQKFISRTLAKLKKVAPETYAKTRFRKNQLVDTAKRQARKRGLLETKIKRNKAGELVKDEKITRRGKAALGATAGLTAAGGGYLIGSNRRRKRREAMMR